MAGGLKDCTKCPISRAYQNSRGARVTAGMSFMRDHVEDRRRFNKKSGSLRSAFDSRESRVVLHDLSGSMPFSQQSLNLESRSG